MTGASLLDTGEKLTESSSGSARGLSNPAMTLARGVPPEIKSLLKQQSRLIAMILSGEMDSGALATIHCALAERLRNDLLMPDVATHYQSERLHFSDDKVRKF